MTVTHMHYTAWPDHGVPENAMSVISFIRRVCAQGASTLPRPATAGTLQCRCRSHWHLHPTGYCDATDEE